MTEPTENLPALALPEGTALVALFKTENGLDPLIERIAAEVRAHVPDLTTAKGRDAIKSLAYKVARSKTMLDDAGKLKAAETAAKTAHTGKVASFQLCKSMDRVAEAYFVQAKKDGKAVKPAEASAGACADPGAFVFTPPAPPAAPGAPAAAAPAVAAAPAAAPPSPKK